MTTRMMRAALAVAALLGVGAVTWIAMPGSGTKSVRETPATRSLEDIRTALAAVHGARCRVDELADIFDLDEIARRTLGRHWHDRTEAERTRAMELLRAYYVRRYARFCERQEHVHFERPIVDGNRAVLVARGIREGHDVPVVYRLRSSDTKRWVVYDVDVGGRSHTRSTYMELDRIILNEGYRHMVEQVAADLGSPRGAPRR
jgi:ABC-type transporter MlaC component